MFNVRFPQNFDSPYKARELIDFWRRWHISLSNFLRDHLYIPLGGNRKGPARRTVNLFLTMLLGGLWHGAGWTFVAWGALHGVYLIVNHAWNRATAARAWAETGAARIAGHAMTLLAVIAGWVIFRADSLSEALRMLGAMSGTAATAAVATARFRLARRRDRRRHRALRAQYQRALPRRASTARGRHDPATPMALRPRLRDHHRSHARRGHPSPLPRIRVPLLPVLSSRSATTHRERHRPAHRPALRPTAQAPT
jgi:hypothetical protein